MKPRSGNKWLVAGTMSGTSLDGLDIAVVEFKRSENRWNFAIIAAETVNYSAEWEEKLRTAPELSGEKLIELHHAYGHFTGQQINLFVKKHQLSPDLIASHGHTVFHQPEKGFTFQAGNGVCSIALFSNFFVPVMIRIGRIEGILNFNRFQPRILTWRLVKMPMNTNMFLHAHHFCVYD